MSYPLGHAGYVATLPHPLLPKQRHFPGCTGCGSGPPLNPVIRILKGRAGVWPSGVMAGQYAQVPALPISHMRLPQLEPMYTAQLQST